MLASIAVGVAMAFAYHLSSARSQLWLSKRISRALPVVSVLAFLVRLTVVGLVFLGIRRWTSLDLVTVAISFVATFTALGAYSLYRFAAKGRSSAPPTPLLP